MKPAIEEDVHQREIIISSIESLVSMSVECLNPDEKFEGQEQREKRLWLLKLGDSLIDLKRSNL